MKKGFIIFIFIITLGMTSSLPSSWGAGSRYNPYFYNPSNPLQNQVIRDPTQVIWDPTVQRYSYEGVDVTRFPRLYIRWYESPGNYQQVYERFGEEPKTLTNPYREVKKPYSSEVLTSPYEEVYSQGLQQKTPTRQLTPPELGAQQKNN